MYFQVSGLSLIGLEYFCWSPHSDKFKIIVVELSSAWKFIYYYIFMYNKYRHPILMHRIYTKLHKEGLRNR